MFTHAHINIHFTVSDINIFTWFYFFVKVCIHFSIKNKIKKLRLYISHTHNISFNFPISNTNLFILFYFFTKICIHFYEKKIHTYTYIYIYIYIYVKYPKKMSRGNDSIWEYIRGFLLIFRRAQCMTINI